MGIRDFRGCLFSLDTAYRSRFVHVRLAGRGRLALAVRSL